LRDTHLADRQAEDEPARAELLDQRPVELDFRRARVAWRASQPLAEPAGPACDHHAGDHDDDAPNTWKP
jgi:hypothetical protein